MFVIPLGINVKNEGWLGYFFLAVALFLMLWNLYIGNYDFLITLLIIGIPLYLLEKFRKK